MLAFHVLGNDAADIGIEQIAEFERCRCDGRAIDTAAERPIIAAPPRGAQALGIAHVLVEQAPFAQRFLQAVTVFGAQFGIKPLVVDRLGEQFGDVAVPICCQFAIALRLATERLGIMHQRLVVELDKGFQRDAERLAIMQDGAVVIGNAPRPGIEIIALGKADLLRCAAKFGIGITAIK